jgi:hypothetical protein
MMEERISALESDIDILNRKVLQLAWKVDDIEKLNFQQPSEAIEELPDPVNVNVYDLRGKLVILESELSEIRIRIGIINEQSGNHHDSFSWNLIDTIVHYQTPPTGEGPAKGFLGTHRPAECPMGAI